MTCFLRKNFEQRFIQWRRLYLVQIGFLLGVLFETALETKIKATIIIYQSLDGYGYFRLCCAARAWRTENAAGKCGG